LRILDIADVWAARTGNSVRLVSANDHVHARRSAHYAGLAVDLHGSNLDALAAMFRRIGYKVLWKVKGHFSHVHVEDPRVQAPAGSGVVPALQPHGDRHGDRDDQPAHAKAAGRMSAGTR
jgi:hypothetical protein